MTEQELRAELGRRLHARRAWQGRTLAAVAMQAGLSVPYVANLENGRGNPTLGSLHRLADALDIRLSELLADPDGVPAGRLLPESLVEFSQGARFRQEARRLAAEGKVSPAEVRHQLLTAMAAIPQPAHRQLDELDWHRILDALVLVLRPR